jgi:hypothetical protein
MRRILNCSPEVAVCGETHYLGHWIGYQGFQHEFAKVADISTDAGAEKVVDYIYHIRPNAWRGDGFWGWVQKNSDRNQFLEKLLASDRSEHAILDVVMALYAGDKPIRGDKTPAHIHSLPTLLSWYPDAKIIHMFRDLRAIFVSEKRRQLMEYITLPYRILWRSELALEMVLSTNFIFHWLRAARLHRQYQELYPHNYHLCRFEDLTSDPETHLKKLCASLELDFSDRMLNLSYQNSSLIPRHQAQGIDASTANRWQKHLHPLTSKWLVWWSKKYLLEFGYQP